MPQIPYRPEFFSGLTFITAQVLFITAKINFISVSRTVCLTDITQDKSLLTVVSSAVPLLFPCSMLCFTVVVRNIADMLPGNIYYSRWLMDIVYAGRIGFVYIITHKYHAITNI